MKIFIKNFNRLSSYWAIKGALDNFSLIPRFFFQKSWDFYTIRSAYLCSDCMLNLTCNFNLITKIWEFFLQQPFLKVYFWKWPPLSLLLNLAPSTITVVWRKILKLVCAVLWTDIKLTEHYVNYDILVQTNYVLSSNINTN